MKSAAEPVVVAAEPFRLAERSRAFTVFFGFIMLLSVLEKAVTSVYRLTVDVKVVPLLGRTLGLGAPAMPAVAPLEKRAVRFLALLSFGVPLWSLLKAVAFLRHRSHLLELGGTAARRVG